MQEEEAAKWAGLVKFISGTGVTLATQGVEFALRYTGAKLLGEIIKFPELWLKERSQLRADRIEARSAYSKKMVGSAANYASEDERLLAHVAQTIHDEAFGKLENKIDVFSSAVEIVSDEMQRRAGQPEFKNADNAAPSDDWINYLGRHAEDASSPNLKDTFAKILAGEIINPGSISRATIRCVGELDQETASAFQDLYSLSINGSIPRYVWISFGYDKIALIRDAGLVNHSPDGLFSEQSNHSVSRVIVSTTPYVAFEVRSALGDRWHTEVFSLTRVGREIGSILAPPDVIRNVKEWAPHLVDSRSRFGLLRAFTHDPLTGQRIDLYTRPAPERG